MFNVIDDKVNKFVVINGAVVIEELPVGDRVKDFLFKVIDEWVFAIIVNNFGSEIFTEDFFKDVLEGFIGEGFNFRSIVIRDGISI